MNNLSITNLVNNNSSAYNVTNGNLDVQSLMSIKNSHDRVKEFNPDVLIQRRIDLRNKLLEIYTRYYDKCIENIKLVNNQNRNDLIFEVPKKISDCPEYFPIFCLNFIEQKLKDNFIDVLRVSYCSIFITWKFIELNKTLK
jgi:hypothetical protein